MSPLDHEPEALQYALTKSGLTQREFAAQMGVSPSMVSEMLKGTRNMTPANQLLAARILNCPVVVIERKREASAA